MASLPVLLASLCALCAKVPEEGALSSLTVFFGRPSEGTTHEAVLASARRLVFLHFGLHFSGPLFLRNPLVAGVLKRLSLAHFITNFINLPYLKGSIPSEKIGVDSLS